MPPTPVIRIEPAKLDDVPLILSLIGELAEYERLSHEVTATEDGVREALFGARPVAETLIAYLDGEAVGFALFFTNFSTFVGRPGIYLEDLFVRPAARRVGVGRRLFAHVARLARDRGCGRLEWSVLDWNEPALRFYGGLGARPMSDWTIQRLTGEALNRLAAESDRS